MLPSLEPLRMGARPRSPKAGGLAEEGCSGGIPNEEGGRAAKVVRPEASKWSGSAAENTRRSEQRLDEQWGSNHSAVHQIWRTRAFADC